MRTKVTLVLIFLNVVLFFYIFEYERKFAIEQDLMVMRKRVYGPEVASIDSFTRIERAGPTVHVEKRGDQWWLTQPHEWPANLNAVERILNELQLLEHETSFKVSDLANTEGRTLSDYGLADPALTFIFTSGGKTYTTKVGDDTKTGSRLYLLSPDGTRIHVVNRALADTLEISVDTLRSPSIFTVPVFEVRSLSLQTAAPANLKVRLRREGDRWSFETPILARANTRRVESAIGGLNDLRAKRFLEPREIDADRAGLTAPTLRVTLEGNARRETLLLGGPVGGDATSGDYYAKVEDKSAIFTVSVPATLVDDLRNAQEKLRDPHILDLDIRNVTAITLSAPGQPDLGIQRLEVPQGTEAWQLVIRTASGQAPQTLAGDSATIGRLLQEFQHLEARKFLSDAPSASDLENWGFNRPEREISINLGTGGAPRSGEASTITLQVGVKPADRAVAFARVANAPFVYEVDPEILESTPVLATHFRQRLLRTLPVGASVTGLTLTEIGAAQPIYAHQLAAGITSWDIPLSLETDRRRRAITGLLTQMRALQARRFLANSFNPDHAETEAGPQPWKYRLDITLALTGGSGSGQVSTSTLLLTERLGGSTQIAGTSEFGGVTFEVTPELLDSVFALAYADKQDPGPPAKPAPPAGTESPKTESPPGK
ncbi:MAG TPA: DUF4340 domain-containing protein [Candidatus Didemnitutus sp.]|jgi:hypothetical protein